MRSRAAERRQIHSLGREPQDTNEKILRKPRSGDRNIAVIPVAHGIDSCLSPPPGASCLFVVLTLGLTLQGKNMPRLRRSNQGVTPEDLHGGSTSGANLFHDETDLASSDLYLVSGLGCGLPVVSGNRHGSADPGTTRQAFVIAAMLGRQNLAFLLSHRREILDTFHNLHTAKAAERDTVTRLTKPEPGLQHRIQETCFVNDSHLAARGLEMNGRHLDIEFWETQSLTFCATPAPCSLINPPQRLPALQAYETWGGQAEFLIPKSEMGGRVGNS